MVMALELGDVLTLRKPHPCGGLEWRVERLGADIGIRCLTCAHYLMVPPPAAPAFGQTAAASRAHG